MEQGGSGSTGNREDAGGCSQHAEHCQGEAAESKRMRNVGTSPACAALRAQIDRPEVFTSVSSAFQGEFTARLWNDFASAWNYGVLSVREGVDQAMGSRKE